MKVKVQNFQSIKDAEIEVDGFTVITGANNSGKTALIRALRGAFQNTAGNTFVRHGEDNCRVEVDLGDSSFAWEKGKKKPTYEVGSKTLNPGREVPSEVSDLGVRSILAGGREIWPQIANQFSGQVFLVDQPGSVLAEAVADVERVGKLNRALKASEKDRRSASSELKVRKKDLNQFEEDLERYEGVDDLGELVAKCEEHQIKLGRIEDWLSGLQGLKERYDTAIEVVDSLSGLEDVFDSFDQTDEVLTELSSISTEIKELSSLRDRFSASTKDLTFAQQAVDSVENIELPAMEKVDKLVRAIKTFTDMKDRWGVASTQVSEIRSDILTAEKELEVLDKEIKDTLGEIGECPMCGADHSDASPPLSVIEVGGAI
tara:strand:- start:6129 stop:7250 length:1122 start_codon:yes stop_codon:yes gene_type:complete